jgi:hypothetical protein
MARENADEVERNAVIGNDPKTVDHLRPDDPIGVWLDVDQMTNADKPFFAAKRVEKFACGYRRASGHFRHSALAQQALVARARQRNGAERGDIHDQR